MISRPVHAVWLPSSIDACALWRMYMPYQNIPGSSFFTFHEPVFSLIVDHDVAVVQRCYAQQQLNFIRACRKAEMKVIMDLDDDVWHVPEYNPAYEMLNAVKTGFSVCLQMVDVITVSTKPLAKMVRQEIGKSYRKNLEIVVVENRIDTKLFAKPRQSERLIVGWAGSSSHMSVPGQRRTGDLGLIEETIAELAPQHKDVLFQFRGGIPREGLLDQENIEYQPWVPVAEYASRMPRWGWGIALAPLTDLPFNHCKSAIKMIEAGYCGIPCLASQVEPYDRFTSTDPELKWLLCRTDSDWHSKIRELINDRGRREHLGARMKAAAERCTFNTPHEGWERALKMVM